MACCKSDNGVLPCFAKEVCLLSSGARSKQLDFEEKQTMTISCMSQASGSYSIQAYGIHKDSKGRMVSQAAKNPRENESMFPLNEPVTKFSARLIRKQMLAGGRKLSKADRRYLKHMIDYGKLLDSESLFILLDLMLCAPQE